MENKIYRDSPPYEATIIFLTYTIYLHDIVTVIYLSYVYFEKYMRINLILPTHAI